MTLDLAGKYFKNYISKYETRNEATSQQSLVASYFGPEIWTKVISNDIQYPNISQ